MGLYQLVLSVYMVLATLATSGITVSVSKLTAEQFAKKNYRAAKRILYISMLLMGTVGLFAGIVLYFGADFAGNILLKDSRTVLALRCLAPGLPFLSVSSCITGYFYAQRAVFKPAGAQIFEQIVKLTVVYALFALWADKGAELAIAAAVLGITASDTGICIYQYIMFRLSKRKKSDMNASMRNIVTSIFRIMLPVAANSYINSTLRLIENIVIPSSLKKSGLSKADALGHYGTLKGMVLPLLMFPSAFLTALAATIIPAVAGANINKNKEHMNFSLSKALQLTLVLGIVIVAVFMMFSYDIGIVIYNSDRAGSMLQTLSFICPFLYTEIIVVAILNGLGQQLSPLKINVFDSTVRISMIYFLIPFIGINGFVIAIGVSCVLSTTLYLKTLLKVTTLRFEFINWVLKPTLAAAASALSVHFFVKASLSNYLTLRPALVIGVFVILVIYFILIFALGSVTVKDFKWLKESLLSKR